MDRIRWYLITNYIVIQVGALVLAYFLWIKGFEIPATMKDPRVPWVLIGMLVTFSAILLLLVRLGLSNIVYYTIDYGILFILIFLTLFVLGSPFWISAVCSGFVVILRHAVPRFKHVSVIIFAGITAAVTGFLHVYSVIALLLAYFLYDIIFAKVEYMQEIADDAYKKNSSLVFTLDTKKGTFVMGSADMILPSVFVVSAFRHWFEASNASTAVAGAGLVSLFILGGLLMATRKKETPAMPYASVGIIGFLIVEAVLLLL